MKNYTDLNPALPWIIPTPSSTPPILPETRPARTLAAGDFDGDSRREVVVVNGAAPALCLVSYFQYADVDPRWAADTTPQMVNYFTQPVIASAQTNGQSWIVSQNDLVLAGDLDGDGKDEILIFNPADQWIGVLEWGGTELQCVWATTNSVPSSSGEGGWYISPLDQHFVGDFDGDGKDEIFVYNPADLWVGLLKWNGTELQAKWMLNNQVPGSGGDWGVFIEDQYFVGDFDGDGADEIFAFSPIHAGDIGERDVGVLKWDGTGLQCIWVVSNLIQNKSGEGGWSVQPQDRYFPANLEGGVADNIFVFNPDDQWVGVLEWVGGGLQCSWATNNPIPSSSGEGGWDINVFDHHYVGNFQGKGKDEIFVFDPDDQWVGVLGWAGGGLQAIWMAQNLIPSSSGEGGWDINTPDLYFPADFDGDGSDEILVINPVNQWIGALRWDGPGLQNIWATPSSFPAWGLSLLTSGPTTPFPYSTIPFTATQEPIYQYISSKISASDDVRSLYPTWAAGDFEKAQQALDGLSNPGDAAPDWDTVMAALSQDFVYGYVSDYLNPECQGDIRGEYDNHDDKGYFATWASNAANLAASPPDGFNFSPTDPYGRYQLFSKVALQISSECECPSSVMDLIASMNELAGDLKTAQEGQLNTVIGNITQTVDPAVNQVAWWMGQIADALLWGAAAVPFGEGAAGINIALSITSSVFGSLLSSGAPAGNNTPPPPVLLSDFETLLDENYGTAISDNGDNEQVILGDPVKMSLIFKLTQQAWKWPSNFDSGVFSQSAYNNYRLYFYRQLLPMAFQIMTWAEATVAEPYHVYYIIVKGGRYPEYGSIGAPQQAYLSRSNSDGTYDIYMLYQGPSSIDDYKQFQYPGQSMTDDLFQVLGVSQSDFFTGANGWNIPTVTAYSGQ